MDGKVEAICVSQQKGQIKYPVLQTELRADFGIVGDAHAGSGHRQISMLNSEDVEIFQSHGVNELPPGVFAENLRVSGVNLAQLGLGTLLRGGSGWLIEITQIGKICHHHCAIYEQVGDCVMPRQGLFGRVLIGGNIACNDPMVVERKIPREAIQAVVLTMSDRCSRGETEDTAGPAVAELLASSMGAHVYRQKILPDNREQLSSSLKHYADGHSIDLIIAVGGTGFSPGDVTPEAIREVVDRYTPGLDEAMRNNSAKLTANAWLSRAVSGIRQSTLILSVPGSRRAARENLQAIFGILPHAMEKLRGDPSDCGRIG